MGLSFQAWRMTSREGHTARRLRATSTSSGRALALTAMSSPGLLEPLIAQVQRRVEHGDAGEGPGTARLGHGGNGAAEGTADAVLDAVVPGFIENLRGNRGDVIGESLPLNPLGQQRGI